MPRVTGRRVALVDGMLVAVDNETVSGDVTGASPIAVPNGSAVTSVEAAGDSWPAAFGSATPGTYGYVARLAKLLGGVTASNLGQSGAGAAGLASEGGVAKILQTAATIPAPTAGPYFSKGGLKIAQVGYNDQTYLGSTGTAASAVTENCLTAFYSALKAARHLKVDDATVVASGALGAGDSTLVMGTGYYYMSTNGQYVQYATDAAYNGDAQTILIPHFAAFATTGTLEFRANPAGANTLLGTYSGAANDGALKAPVTDRNATCCFRIPRGTLAPGVNTIRMTASGLTGSNFCTWGGTIIEGKAPLLLPLYKARDSSLDTQIAWANARIRAAAALFDNTSVVSLDAHLNESRLFADVSHPNDLGNARIAGALLAALPGLLTQENTGEMN